MQKWDVELVLDVGDPETVAKIRLPGVEAENIAAAAEMARVMLDGPGPAADWFTSAELIQILVTRQEPGVAANLLSGIAEARLVQDYTWPGRRR